MDCIKVLVGNAVVEVPPTEKMSSDSASASSAALERKRPFTRRLTRRQERQADQEFPGGNPFRRKTRYLRLFL